jgi:hypothetical protein
MTEHYILFAHNMCTFSIFGVIGTEVDTIITALKDGIVGVVSLIAVIIHSRNGAGTWQARGLQQGVGLREKQFAL